jgi:alkylhydroperoxidase family enzyme
MKRLLKSESLDADAYLFALSQQVPGEPFTVREQLGIAYASKLTHVPAAIERADIDALRDSGFDDGEILELNQVAAYFAYANRTVSGLGVDTEGEVLGLSPETGGDESGWSHG